MVFISVGSTFEEHVPFDTVPVVWNVAFAYLRTLLQRVQDFWVMADWLLWLLEDWLLAAAVCDVFAADTVTLFQSLQLLVSPFPDEFDSEILEPVSAHARR